MRQQANGSKARIPAKTRIANCKLTPDQYRMIEQCAGKCQLSMGAWMRSVLLQAASKPAKDGYIRIHEPDGAMI